jgi:hypothetical protein
VVSYRTHKKTDSGIKGNGKLVSEKKALVPQLGINEIQELQTVYMRPLVRNILASLIVQFEIVLSKTHCRQKSNTKEERKWLDMVVGRNPHTSENNLSAIHNFEMVITSRFPHPYKGNHGMETSKIIHSSTMRRITRNIRIKEQESSYWETATPADVLENCCTM